MPSPNHHQKPPFAFNDFFWISGFVYLISFAAVYATCFYLISEFRGLKFDWETAWTWLKYSSFSINSPEGGAVIASLKKHGLLLPARVTCVSSILLPFIPSLWLGLKIAQGAPGEVHLKGRKLSCDPDEAAEEMKKEIKISGHGINIHPSIPLSKSRESRHIFIVGAPGSGKTVVIRPLVERAIAKKDRVLVYDNKGDFTKMLPRVNGAKGIVIFAPWDKRGVAWDIAADCQNRSDARDISARLVPESERDPVWGLAAQSILTGVICKYQHEKPVTWDFSDILEDVFKGYDHLRAVVLKYNREAIYAVEDAKKTQTTTSFLINLSTFLSQVVDLAEAWKGKKKISFRRWLLDKESFEYRSNVCRLMILQGNKHYGKLEKAYMHAIVSSLSSIVNSPELPDSTKRRVWLFLDEFPQLKKLNDISPFIEIGRSKGVRVVLAAQDISQIREVYGDNVTESWTSMVGTYIICKAQGKETPKWLSELIGKRKIRRYRPSYSVESTPLNNTMPGQRTDNWEEVEEPVLRPDEITNDLGERKNGIEAIFFPSTKTVYQIIWPFTEKKRRRPGVVPAEWTKSAQPLFKKFAEEAIAKSEPATDSKQQEQKSALAAAERPKPEPQRKKDPSMLPPGCKEEQEEEQEEDDQVMADETNKQVGAKVVTETGALEIAVKAAESADVLKDSIKQAPSKYKSNSVDDFYDEDEQEGEQEQC